MKIFEITDENSFWGTLKDIGFEYTEEYEYFRSSLELLIKMKTPNRTKYFMPAILEFVERLKIFVQTNFPDMNDPDLISKRDGVKEMIKTLENLIRKT